MAANPDQALDEEIAALRAEVTKRRLEQEHAAAMADPVKRARIERGIAAGQTEAPGVLGKLGAMFNPLSLAGDVASTGADVLGGMTFGLTDAALRAGGVNRRSDKKATAQLPSWVPDPSALGHGAGQLLSSAVGPLAYAGEGANALLGLVEGRVPALARTALGRVAGQAATGGTVNAAAQAAEAGTSGRPVLPAAWEGFKTGAGLGGSAAALGNYAAQPLARAVGASEGMQRRALIEKYGGRVGPRTAGSGGMLDSELAGLEPGAAGQNEAGRRSAVEILDRTQGAHRQDVADPHAVTRAIIDKSEAGRAHVDVGELRAALETVRDSSRLSRGSAAGVQSLIDRMDEFVAGRADPPWATAPVNRPYTAPSPISPAASGAGTPVMERPTPATPVMGLGHEKAILHEAAGKTPALNSEELSGLLRGESPAQPVSPDQILGEVRPPPIPRRPSESDSDLRSRVASATQPAIDAHRARVLAGSRAGDTPILGSKAGETPTFIVPQPVAPAAHAMSQRDLNNFRGLLWEQSNVEKHGPQAVDEALLRQPAHIAKRLVDEGPYAATNAAFHEGSKRYERQRQLLGLPKKSRGGLEAPEADVPESEVTKLGGALAREGQDTASAGLQNAGRYKQFISENDGPGGPFARLIDAPDVLRAKGDLQFKLGGGHGAAHALPMMVGGGVLGHGLGQGLGALAGGGLGGALGAFIGKNPTAIAGRLLPGPLNATATSLTGHMPAFDAFIPGMGNSIEFLYARAKAALEERERQKRAAAEAVDQQRQ